jgi:predicted nucleic acid-binding protein
MSAVPPAQRRLSNGFVISWLRNIGLQILAYTPDADLHFRFWKQQGMRVSTHDLRIAAICVAHQATLLTRNRRDFERIPGLAVEFLS